MYPLKLAYNFKKLIEFYNLIIYNIVYRGVAQMVARCVRDAEVAGSSPVTPTSGP